MTRNNEIGSGGTWFDTYCIVSFNWFVVDTRRRGPGSRENIKWNLWKSSVRIKNIAYVENAKIYQKLTIFGHPPIKSLDCGWKMIFICGGSPHPRVKCAFVDKDKCLKNVRNFYWNPIQTATQIKTLYNQFLQLRSLEPSSQYCSTSRRTLDSGIMVHGGLCCA